MTCTLHVAWDERLAGYDFGPSHPMAPIRLKLTMELARAFGLFGLDGVSVEVPAAATRAELELYHSPVYIDMVRLAGSGRQLGEGQQDLTERVLLMHGLGTEDDPVFPGMHEAAAMVTGATLAAARAVWTSAAQHGASIAGGLHHAMAGNASGFCVYNDPAIAIAWLLGQGAERIAYVDVDAHHGDGVERAFWDDPRVLTIGLHEHPESLFPGTGWPGDTGGRHAEGSAVNVALPALTGDAGWLRAFHAVVPPLLREFRPQILASQHGCDSHRDDPLTNLELTIDAQRAAHAAIHALAHECADGRWLLTGGGGYEHVSLGNMITREPLLARFVRHISPRVTAVHLPPYAAGFTAIVALKNPQPGEARNVAIAAMAAHVNFKTVIVVDSNVDIFDPADVMWALGTRVRWHEDVIPIPGAHGNELDPSTEEHGVASKAIIDATLPPEKHKRYVKVAYPPVDLERYLKGN